jgi:L-threonylcarbamoyladenylate synthase
MSREQDLNECLNVVQSGGVILYPTDTIWGLGCDAFQREAVNKIFEIKNRPSEKRVILLVNSWEMLNRYADVNPKEQSAMERFYLEYPTTFVFEKVKNLPSYLLSEDGSVAIRIIPDGFAHELIEKLNIPITSTSANLAGQPSPMVFDDIPKVIKDSVDYIVPIIWDKGNGKPSKIVKLHPDNGCIVIRG